MTTTTATTATREQRAEKLVAQGYQVQRLRADRHRVFNPATHGSQGGYIVDATAQTCSCPDYMRRALPCKHMIALPELIRLAVVTKPVVRIPAVVTTPKPVVYGVQPHSPRMAAMIARDGWGEPVGRSL